MVRHIVTWNFKEGLTDDDKKKAGQKFKEDIENLVGVVEGLVEANVIIEVLESSNAQILLNTLHKSINALEIYGTHPQHVLAGKTAKENFVSRQCVDYIE